MAELVNTIASHTGSGESSRSIAYDEDELVERLGAFAGGFAYIGVTLGLLWLSLRLDLTTGRIDWFKHYFG